jgi:hypothetical protein
MIAQKHTENQIYFSSTAPPEYLVDQKFDEALTFLDGL